jgi:hypothetical protein
MNAIVMSASIISIINTTSPPKFYFKSPFNFGSLSISLPVSLDFSVLYIEARMKRC